jgi:hypothetical protein
LSVIDHHFPREGQFPSACAAVLHKARLIREKFNPSSGDVIWLVTDKEPDFDAFCSMYLRRSIIEAPDVSELLALGLSEDGWFNSSGDQKDASARTIDWYEPRLQGIPASIRWMTLLASYAYLQAVTYLAV